VLWSKCFIKHSIIIIISRIAVPDDTAVSCAKMAEPIEMPFGLWTRVGMRMHVLDGVHTGDTW